MNAEALLHTIRVKAPSEPQSRLSLAAFGEKISALITVRPSRNSKAEPFIDADQTVGFETVVSSAIMAPPRRLNWHRLAILDFVLTGAVVFGGGFCAWKLIELVFGFLAW
jgi:hypothetical protein